MIKADCHPKRKIFFPSHAERGEGRVRVELEKYKKRGISKAFTLLELLAVIVILSIISTITIPIFANKKEDARNIADKQNTIELKKGSQ